MRITNKYNLPQAFVRAVKNDGYNRQGTYSPSVLNSPARAIALVNRHADEIEIDALECFARVFGQSVHSLLERAARPLIDIVEERFFCTIDVDGVIHKLSAQIDLYESDTKTLSDWKTCKAYAFSKKAGKGVKPEWTAQLNIARYIMARQEKPIEVKRLQIIGLLKNWEERDANKNGYPPIEVMTANQPLWGFEETEAYVIERIRAHEAARFRLPKCTPQETWSGLRCKRFCEARSVCDQFKQSQKTGLIAPEESE